MAKTKLDDKRVTCPFFRWHDHTSITCEGMMPGMETTCRLNYPKAAEKQKQWEIYCCKNWRYCEMAQSILKHKYDEETTSQERILAAIERRRQNGAPRGASVRRKARGRGENVLPAGP
jgi:hypothetical protein